MKNTHSTFFTKFLVPKYFWGIGILLLLFSFLSGKSGFIRQFKLYSENKKLQRDIAIEKAKQKWLENELDSLKNDMARLKKEAYKNGYGKEDEIIILFR